MSFNEQWSTYYATCRAMGGLSLCPPIVLLYARTVTLVLVVSRLRQEDSEDTAQNHVHYAHLNND